MSPFTVYIAALSQRLAGALSRRLLQVSAAVVRGRFDKDGSQAALKAAISEALAVSLPAYAPNLLDRGFYEGFFREFLMRDSVVAELAHLLDPQPGYRLRSEQLCRELKAAGLDRRSLPGFDLESFLNTFAGAFYSAAARQRELRQAIEMKLLADSV